jgi:hypothetical protein
MNEVRKHQVALVLALIVWGVAASLIYDRLGPTSDNALPEALLIALLPAVLFFARVTD